MKKVLLWLVTGVPLVLLSPILDIFFRVYFYYKREFERMKNIIDDIDSKEF